MQGARVLSLVWELISHMSRGMGKKKKKNISGLFGCVQGSF